MCRLFDLFEKGANSAEELASGAACERMSVEKVQENLSSIIEKSKKRHIELLNEKRRAMRRARSKSGTRSRSRSKSRSERGGRSRSSSRGSSSDREKSNGDRVRVAIDDLAMVSDLRPTKAIEITHEDDYEDRKRNSSDYYPSSSSSSSSRHPYNPNRANTYDRF